MSTSNSNSAGLSELTLTPAIDGVSDYQQYLEKTSKKGSSLHIRSREQTSVLNSLPPTAITATHRASSTVVPSSPMAIVPEVPAASRFERIKTAGSRKKRRRRPHRVEAVEDPHEYPGPLALSFLTIGICLSVFLVSLDRTIVATVRISFSLGKQSSRADAHLRRPYRVLLMTSTHHTTLVGMEAHTL